MILLFYGVYYGFYYPKSQSASIIFNSRRTANGMAFRDLIYFPIRSLWFINYLGS